MMVIRRAGAIAGLIGPVVFVLVFLVEGWLRPGYSPSADFVSALALGSRGWVQIANFLLCGSCVVLLALAIAREHWSSAAGRAGSIMLGVIGLGLLLSGPFVMDPGGSWLSSTTPHGMAHSILGAIVFLLMPIAPFVLLSPIRRRRGRRGLWRTTLVLGTITAAADAVFTVASKVPELAAATAPYAGLLQRSVLIPFMIWLVALALDLLLPTPAD